MGKSLAPLIVVIAVVVILTIIIINSDMGVKAKKTTSWSEPKTPRVALSKHHKNPEFQEPPKHIRHNGTTPLIRLDKQLILAKKYLAAGRADLAEEQLRTILVFYPENMQALTLLGGILFYSQRYAAAELIFRRQVKIAPKSHLAYNKLGSALAKQKKFKLAIDNALVAVGIKPDSGEAQINLAGMFAAVGENKQSLKYLRQAAKLLGRAILPLTDDHVFDKLREMPEFQEILSKAATN
jgi:tetratricopeptide (TPR) repeat protein